MDDAGALFLIQLDPCRHHEAFTFVRAVARHVFVDMHGKKTVGAMIPANAFGGRLHHALAIRALEAFIGGDHVFTDMHKGSWFVLRTG